MKSLICTILIILILGCTISINNNENRGNNLNNSIVENPNTDNDSHNVIINTGNNQQNNNSYMVENNTNTDDTVSDNTYIIVDNSQITNVAYTTWTDGSVSLEVPNGWSVVSYGNCATKSFIAYDPEKPIRQVFYYSETGPVYTSQAQKNNDLAYQQMGGYPLYYSESPVITPLTAENFLKGFKAFAETAIMVNAAPLTPKMSDFQIISSTTPTNLIFPSATDAKTIRALFKQDNNLGEGLFYLETFDYGIITYGFNNIGFAMTFIGLTAGDNEFQNYEAILNHIIKSYTISESYVSACIQAQNQAVSGALRAGRTLSETSDIIMDVWDNRQTTDDILSERWSDTTLGYERVYDPSTGEVYRVENGFYENYNIHRNNFEMNNLEPLPETDWNLWTAATNPENYIR
ncbi:Uncharacterised protein [Candidatus Tiddalikarchaeum anstoanum]|nr:Uncharacterised protein [Candidatus Tiddalikarchaeum anstoanum]